MKTQVLIHRVLLYHKVRANSKCISTSPVDVQTYKIILPLNVL